MPSPDVLKRPSCNNYFWHSQSTQKGGAKGEEQQRRFVPISFVKTNLCFQFSTNKIYMARQFLGQVSPKSIAACIPPLFLLKLFWSSWANILQQRILEVAFIAHMKLRNSGLIICTPFHRLDITFAISCTHHHSSFLPYIRHCQPGCRVHLWILQSKVVQSAKICQFRTCAEVDYQLHACSIWRWLLALFLKNSEHLKLSRNTTWMALFANRVNIRESILGVQFRTILSSEYLHHSFS